MKNKSLVLIMIIVLITGSMSVYAKSDPSEELTLAVYNNLSDYKDKVDKVKNTDLPSVSLIKNKNGEKIDEDLVEMGSYVGYEIQETSNIVFYGTLELDGIVNALIIESDDEAYEYTDKELDKLAKEVVKKQKDRNDKDAKKVSVEEDTMVSAKSAPSNYSLVGSAIHLNIKSGTTILYYNEYRWYTGGGNGTTNFYYLRKDFESIDIEHTHNLKKYDSKFSEYGNSYTVDFLDPTPEDDANVKSYSISYTWGISYSFQNDSNYDLNMSFSQQNDTAQWVVSALWYQGEMQDLLFKQGVYIESSANNSQTKVKDYT